MTAGNDLEQAGREEPTSRPALAVAMILNRALTAEEEGVVAEYVERGETSPSAIAAALVPDEAPEPWEGMVFDALLGSVGPQGGEAGGLT